MTRFSILVCVTLSAVLANQATAQPGGGAWPWGCSTSELEGNSPGACLDANGAWCAGVDPDVPDGVVLLEILPAETVYELTQAEESVNTTARITIEGWCEFVEDCSLMPDPGTYLYEWETTVQACWTVGGSAGVEATTGLATRLLAEVNANVQINGEMSGCRTTRELHAVERGLANCFDTSFWEEYGTLSVTGTVYEYPGGIRISCNCDGADAQEFIVWCDATAQSSGNADNVSFITLKRDDELCCEPPPEGSPCCGCGAGS